MLLVRDNSIERTIVPIRDQGRHFPSSDQTCRLGGRKGNIFMGVIMRDTIAIASHSQHDDPQSDHSSSNKRLIRSSTKPYVITVNK